MTSQISEGFGRLFEVGFNVGALNCIEQYKIKHNYGSLYREELQQLNYGKIRQRITDKVISALDRDIAQTWSTFFLQTGFLNGLNFCREYLNAIGWDQAHRLKRVEVVYFHCRFSGENSLGTYDIENDESWYRRVLTQLPFDNRLYIDEYKTKGEFLNADTLVLLKYGNSYRVLCVDLSAFAIRSQVDVQNLDYVEIIRNLLRRDVSYLRSKSVFSRLRLDTGTLDFEISPDLKSYFSAFKYDDKESAKLIQAAGYIYSFYQFLRATQIIPDNASLCFNAVGYSNRYINAMSVNKQNLDILKTCYEIYKYDSSDKDMQSGRLSVMNRIKRSAYTSFENGKEFIDAILAVSPGEVKQIPTHSECITGFVNSVATLPPDLTTHLGLPEKMNLRDAHALLLKKSLLSSDSFVFLTGNPGIGKTTAIVDFLKLHIDEGFLFFYVSPRKQVNLDIIEKFKVEDKQRLCDDRIFTINSHSNLINDNFGRATVEYTSNQHQGKLPKQGVEFIDSKDTESQSKRTHRLKDKSDNRICDAGRKSRGVLESVCEAISTVIENNISNQIVATTSIQALKISNLGTTLKHFEKIFRNAYDPRAGKIFPERMQQVSSRIKHFFVMIDEITGDDTGVEFLHAIHAILDKYKLYNSNGFNTKIIVADASIVNQEIITQHLSQSAPEPDKIYFRRASDESKAPITKQHFKFKNLPATIINTNSYPAKSLTITYKLLIQIEEFNEHLVQSKSYIDNSIRDEILKDIEALLDKPDVEQFIVYIQNKKKLSELIAQIKKHRKFELYIDYLEIHANLSEQEKQKIHDFQNDVKVVFMTASGSRGLSFPKVKNILVEIPKFQIEKNLMEIIQVIYRGRGNEITDNQDKELTFYLASTSYYELDKEKDKDKQISQQKSLLSLIDILLLLKAAIMTRIFGTGRIGRDNFIIVPIGGKSIFAAGESYSAQMSNLINLLKQEIYRNRSDILLQNIYKSLKQLLGEAEFVIQGAAKSNYLTLREAFNKKFLETHNTLDKLLDFKLIEPAYINGGILIVPIPKNTLEETYLMKLADINELVNDELWRNMQKISHSQYYPESLRAAIKDAIELIKKLREKQEADEINKNHYLELHSLREDQYYAFPLFAFISGEAMRAYFSNQPEEPEDRCFRDILATYIHTCYPVGNILPIGSNYKEFPFVVFRSYSLKERRQKVFTDNYLLSSNELNVLNIILSN